MTYKQICSVDSNQIIVLLPPDFSKKKLVTVVVDDQVDSWAQKLEQLKLAANDPLFLADMKEISDDF